MQLSALLMIVGVVVFWAALLILVAGKKPGVSVGEIFGDGRRVYDRLNQFFSRPFVVAYKFLAFAGLSTLLAGILMTILDVVS